jgi:aspartate/methionine/tyrosine aminotransferase
MNLSEQARGLVGQPMFAFKKRVGELEKKGKNIIHLEIGDSCYTPPDDVLMACAESVLSGDTHYTNACGIDELREEIAKSVFEEYGFFPTVDNIAVLPANAAIDFVIRCTCDVGDEVIVPDPCFPTYTSVLSYTGITAVAVPLDYKDGFKLRYKDVAKRVSSKTKLIILNSPSNPTGAMMDGKDIAKIYDLARSKHITILTDEVYSKIAYKLPPLSSATMDKCRSNVVLLKSFSKEYAMAGFRLGYIVAPEHFARKISLMMETIFSCMPRFIQKAGIAALEYNKGSVTWYREHYKECRDYLHRSLNNMGFKCHKPDGAFYMFPKVTGDDKTAQEKFLKHGVAVLAGSYFGYHGNGHLRICFANTMENIREAVSRMEGIC